jgi:hypothetical protein
VTLVPWATLDDLPADRPALPGGDEEWPQYLAAASEVLYALTGRRFAGVRTRAIELYAPCSSGGVCCRRCRPARVRLPNRDAVELLTVGLPSGAAVDVTRYRIAPGGYLERALGSDAILPGCGSPLAVRYRFGRAPSPAGVGHAAHLAVTLAQTRLDPDHSPLAAGVTQISRQGVTFTQQAAADLIAAGQTGLPSVDVWLGSINPNRLRRPPRSWSPDTDAPYRPIPEEAPTP